MFRIRFLAALGVLLVPLPASGQGIGHLRGTVHDSLLTRGPLAGAEVSVIGLDRSARTDATGHWFLDSVPAGRWRLAFTHPSLDAARLTAPVQVVEVIAGEQTDAALGTPSEAALYARFCAEPRPTGTGMLLGAATIDERPAAGAAVRVLWREWALVPGAEPEERTRDATLTLDGSGRFSICGVPTDRLLTVAGTSEGRQSRRELRLEGRQLGLVHLALGIDDAGAGDLLAGAGASAAEETAVVVAEADGAGRLLLRGSIRDRDGQPLRDIRVALLGTPATTTTRDNGTFEFAQVERAVLTLDVAGLGYIPRRVEVDVRPGRMRRADLALEKVAYVLQPLRATGTADARLSALERRLRMGNGQYLTASQIRQRRAISVSDLLKGMSGVLVRTAGMSNVVIMTRGAGLVGRSLGNGCIPAFFVDGSMVGTETQGDAIIDSLLNSTGTLRPAGAGDGNAVVGTTAMMPRDVGPDQFVAVSDIATLEVYTSAAQIPPEFATYNGGCGVVAIWTRRGLPTVIDGSEDT